MNADNRDAERTFQGSDVPTPPAGLPESGYDLPTPPNGTDMSSGVISPDDFGTPSPAVLGGTDPVSPASGDAGDWPTLEYRSRAKKDEDSGSSGALGWFRRRRKPE